jgi:hypothetical protein
MVVVLVIFHQDREVLADLAAEAALADLAAAVSAAEVPEEAGKKLLHDIKLKKVP